MTTSALAAFGSLLADHTRSELLTALMDGRAYTGGELARHVRVSPSTASEHLSKLREAGLVHVEAQGRHRYFRLADSRVAELIETLGSAPVPPAAAPRSTMAYARTCYDHLAGELAVRIFDQLLLHEHVLDQEGHLDLSSSGRALLDDIGAGHDTAAATRRPVVRSCLDWTERRHHLAGAAGAALLRALQKRRWIAPGPRPRSIRITRSGHTAIPEVFGLPDLSPLHHR